jgi:hypothetical protein
MKKKRSQNDMILDYLKSGKSITPLEALDKFGCMRLGARIADLRREGHPIKSITVVKDGKHFSKYSMETEQ